MSERSQIQKRTFKVRSRRIIPGGWGLGALRKRLRRISKGLGWGNVPKVKGSGGADSVARPLESMDGGDGSSLFLFVAVS